MNDLNPLLLRQLTRLGLSVDAPPQDTGSWVALLRRIAAAYDESRQDRYLMERALRLVSTEMEELNAQLKARAESRLRDERDRLEAVIRALTDGFASLDLDGALTTVNPAAEEMFGSVALGDHLLAHLRLSPPAKTTSHRAAGTEGQGDVGHAELQTEVLARVIDGEEFRDDRAVLVRDGLKDLPVSLLLFPIRQAGVVTGIGVTVRDVSKSITDDRRLRRLARAVDASADAIHITSLEGEIEYVNAAFEEVTGWPAERILGRNTSILHPSVGAEVFADMVTALAAQTSWTGRLLTARFLGPGAGPEPATYWAQATIAPYFDDAGKPLGYVALHHDVTDEVAAERRASAERLAARLRLQVAEELHGPGTLGDRLKRALQVLVDGLPEDGGGEWTAVLVAPTGVDGKAALAAGFGSDRWREIVEHSLGEPLDSVAGFRRFGPDQGSVAAGAMMGLTAPLTIESGTQGRLVLFAKSPFPRQDAVKDAVTAIADMLGLAIAEERARSAAESAREAAVASMQAKSQFLANMSHEIRTPMNGVLGMLNMLTFTDLDANQQEYVTVAHSSAEMLLKVINDILDFSKIEAGKVHLENIPFDLRALTEEVASLFAPLASAKNLELSSFVPPEMPTGVKGDPTRLRQVLVNLIGNALKFTSKGEVSVTASLVDEASGAARIRFDVIDTGIGMSESVVAGLFTSFTQGDASTTRKFGGTGLGLTISRELVVLMGGTIEVSSEVGTGTTFSVTLPLELQPASASQGALIGEGSETRVLVVDDNQTNRLILEHYLTGWGLEHDSAVDGVQGWQLIRRALERGRPYRIVLLDMQMPELDGLGLATRIKADPRLDHTKVVLVSSSGSESANAHADLIDYCANKPIRQSVIRAILREILTPTTPTTAKSDTADQGSMNLSGRVLLVEDTFINRRVGEEMLTRLGLSVSLAVDGSDALEVLAKNEFDVVLMDCQMPVKDGFEATREFRSAESASQHLPIIALTADAMVGTEEKCRSAGMDGYLSKPYTLADLSDALRPWLGEETEQDSATSTVEKAEPITVEEAQPTTTLGAPRISNEDARVSDLASYAILDTPPEDVFDSITHLASALLDMPISLVSLVDDERQWFKSRVGLDATQTPREQAFCGYTILGPEVFVVEDATSDPRFAANPLVTSEPQIRFYAGAPLTSASGFNLGSLCVIDTKPRTMDPEQRRILADLAALTCRELELHKAAATDGLTQVLSRTGLLAQGPSEIARARAANRPLAIVVLDVTNLDSINDTLGMAGGDVALRCVADLCRANLRVGDLVGRLGDDEFGLILRDAPTDIAREHTQRLLSTIEDQHIFPLEHAVRLSANAGIAIVVPDEVDLAAGWERAEAALQLAKAQGPGHLVVD